VAAFEQLRVNSESKLPKTASTLAWYKDK
jgi:hypothetical protein